MNHFLIALQFLTRFPVAARLDYSPAALGRSVLFYPLVGVVIAVALWLVGEVGLLASPQLGAALVVVAWVGLTGALHLDGLADSADAWVGGQGDRARTLAIMKDPRSGPIGVAAVVAVLLLKYAALATLMAQGAWMAAVLLAVVVARGGAVALLASTPYVREAGIGALHAEHLPRGRAQGWLVITAVVLVLLGGGAAFWTLLLLSLLYFGLRSLMIRRLGGTTGDSCGALVEWLEAAALVLMALLA